MHLLAALVAAALLTACASISRPEGGPRDELPPVFLRSEPAPGSLNVTKGRLVAFFDENVQLEDAFNKVIISPVQIQPAAVTANGHRVTVLFRDTLIDSTTYTIDFGDAIKDLNEGNILDGFALDFSTGPTIDTLRIAGMVLQAQNLEPAQAMLVGIYSNLADTAISTLPMERIARTNQYGQFTIRNLKPGTYRIFALNDLNRDYHWDRSEDVAFCDYTISPSAEQIEINDTLRAADGSDSIVARPGVRYLPNDVLLTWFNENFVAPYLKDYARADRRRVTLNFAAPNDSGVVITGVDGALAGLSAEQWSMPEINATADTLQLWLKPEVLPQADSLRLAVRYQRLDSAENLKWTNDTLRLFFRDTTKKKKEKKKHADTDSTLTDSVELTFLNIRSLASVSLDVHKPLTIEVDQPITAIDSAAVRLSMMVDTTWTPLSGIFPAADSLKPLTRRVFDVKWQPGEKYRLEIDSAAVVGLYGEHNKPFRQDFTVKKLEDYSSLRFTIAGLDTLPAVVELLSTADEAVARATVGPDGTALMKYLAPGKYYARLFIDANNNGKWDTGKLLSGLQPEEVYYYDKRIDLKGNWDVEQSWDLYALPIDAQKPYAIKKNKPKLKRGERAPQEDEEGDGFDSEYDDFNDFNGTNRRNTGTTRNTGSNMLSGRMGGLQRANGNDRY